MVTAKIRMMTDDTSLPPTDDILATWLTAQQARQVIREANDGRTVTIRSLYGLLARGSIRGVQIAGRWLVDPESASNYRVMGRGPAAGEWYYDGRDPESGEG